MRLYVQTIDHMKHACMAHLLHVKMRRLASKSSEIHICVLGLQSPQHDSHAQEEEYGRARVMGQWADDADAISEAIDLCPVDCIHYIRRDQLALLEFVMKSCKREDPAITARR